MFIVGWKLTAKIRLACPSEDVGSIPSGGTKNQRRSDRGGLCAVLSIESSSILYLHKKRKHTAKVGSSFIFVE